MTIILRRPFVTKRQKAQAKTYLELAETIAKCASDVEEGYGYTVDEVAYLLQESGRYANQAARCLGFRDISDMYKYKEIHGHI